MTSACLFWVSWNRFNSRTSWYYEELINDFTSYLPTTAALYCPYDRSALCYYQFLSWDVARVGLYFLPARCKFDSLIRRLTWEWSQIHVGRSRRRPSMQMGNGNQEAWWRRGVNKPEVLSRNAKFHGQHQWYEVRLSIPTHAPFELSVRCKIQVPWVARVIASFHKGSLQTLPTNKHFEESALFAGSGTFFRPGKSRASVSVSRTKTPNRTVASTAFFRLPRSHVEA